jgi:3-methyladenine DNA glycosylase AlkD
MPKVHTWLGELRRKLQELGDPARATGQQAYMKSAMPYHGVRNPQVRAIAKEVFASYELDPLGDGELWRSDIIAIWRGAKYREERYAAIELAQLRKARELHRMEALGTFEELIVTGAWWDYVDSLAAHDLSMILRNEGRTSTSPQKNQMRRAMLSWSKCDDIWKRRSAILCQLPLKKGTDLELLYAAIEPSLGRKEFWLRKAIGWALREYAKTDPDEVARYVQANASRLSPLSQREALKARRNTT